MRSVTMMVALLGGTASWAADPVLVQGPQVTITASDLQADSLRMPQEMRPLVLKRAQQVQQISSNLYVRRVMADEAQKLRLDQNPEVQAALRIARDKILSDFYLEYLDSKVTTTPASLLAQAQATYQANPHRFKVEEQVKVRHILVAANEEAKAQKILKDIQGGADFAELAKAHSIDSGSAPKGGDLAPFGSGKMVPAFEKAAFGLSTPGELSGIVPSQFGLHIIQLQAKIPARTIPFEEVRESLIKDIAAKLAQDVRANEAEAIASKAQPQKAAIEAFANDYPNIK